MTGAKLTSLHAVGLKRNGRWLVRDIDLTVHRGEVVSLIGPNGAGKSTVAQIVAGCLKPDAGSVTRLKGIKMGYVPQRVHIDSTIPITVQRLLNVPRRLGSSSVHEVLERFDIEHLWNASVQNLSGGEFQRVFFARALLRKPNLLILDEPNQGLDIRGQAELYDQIHDVRKHLNCGVLLVCHDLHIVMAKTDKVVCMNVHICCTGTAEQIQFDEAYLKLFGHRAIKSHAIYTHSHDHSHHPDGSVMKS